MAYLSPFPYSAAEYKARQAGLTVLSCHYTPLPYGIPPIDHYGNRVQAQRVWIGAKGRESIGSWEAAYADTVQSIHCLATPDLGTVLANIRRALLTADQYKTRADYVEAMQPYWRGDPDILGNSWACEVDCAARAKHALPADLVDWLMAGTWAKW